MTENQSPKLEVSKVSYAIKEPTPPFVNGSENDADKHGTEGTSPHRSRKSQNSFVPSRTAGNSVLISHLENRPDMSFDKSYDDPPHEEPILDGGSGVSPARKHQLRKRVPGSAELGEKAQSALSLLLLDPDPTQSGEGNSSPDASYSPSKKKSLEHPPFGDAVKQEPESPQTSQALPNFVSKKSPLTKFIIPASEAPRQDLLPALHSPDNHHTLPSLQTALGFPGVSKDPAGRPNGSSPYHLPPGTATSPPVLRSELAWDPQRPGHFGPQVPPSPYSHWSPASTKDLSTVSSPASQSSYWRPPKQDKPYLNSPYDAPYSVAKSPATNYPTPTDQTPASTCERVPLNPPPQPNGAVSAGAYKCHYPGCTAPPFQTQYLLNSHANVHSQDRPHFCPIEGCPRGHGGKGFKRKNEMIRHGLVHNSPGYVCPFCPGQEHKYPRPDNLQRHVRVHHVDKSKDDPALRQVLAQRAEGSVRGRRRRQSVQ